MIALSTLEEFLQDPVGRATARGAILLWFKERGQLIIAVSGRPTEEDAAYLARAAEALLAPQAEARTSLLDLRRMEHLEPAVWTAFAANVASRQARYAELVRGCALLVRPDDWHVRTLAEGFPRLLRDALSCRLCTEPAEALDWLGWPAAPAFFMELERLNEQAWARPSKLQALRAHLAKVGGVTLPQAARALGLSPRTLQRQLQAERTTFQGELHLARVLRAQELLRDTDDKVHAIAADLGYARPQHFTAVFRRLTGQTPGAWRARQRKG